MPNELYLIRLIHHATRSAFPGERLWSAAQLTSAATVRFLRLRNREGCDVYILPYADDRNAGYILLDLDGASPTVLERMRAYGLEPCAVVQTSPGHLQAWLHLSRDPLPPILATTVAKHVARTCDGDLASADWRHLGRLAGFTNQKPARRTLRGYAPWVTVLHARAGLATSADQLLQCAAQSLRSAPATPAPMDRNAPQRLDDAVAPAPLSPCEAIRIYHHWIRQWRIAERYPRPDWSIVDLWVARELLSQGTHPAQVRAIVQMGSPQFPRRHGDPQDYLHRTLACAFSRCARRAPVCCSHVQFPPDGEPSTPASSAG